MAQSFLNSVKIAHQFVEFNIFRVFIVATSIKQFEFPLELFFRASLIVCAVEFFLVLSNEILQLWLSLPLSDVNDDTHCNVLKFVFAQSRGKTDVLYLFRNFHNVVQGEFLLLFQNLVLVCEHFGREPDLIVTVSNLLELVLGQLEDLGFSMHFDVHIHDVLHEEGTLVDDRSRMESF